MAERCTGQHDELLESGSDLRMGMAPIWDSPSRGRPRPINVYESASASTCGRPVRSWSLRFMSYLTVDVWLTFSRQRGR